MRRRLASSSDDIHDMALSIVHRLARGLEACARSEPKVSVDDLLGAFVAVFREHPEGLRLTVGPKGLAHADFAIAGFSPESGVGMRRLHGDGVRGLSFRRAPTKGELARLVRVLRDGPALAGWLDDMATVLMDARLSFLDVVLEDTTRGRMAVEEPPLLASIPPAPHQPEAIPDGDVAAVFQSGLAKAIVRPTPWLGKSVLALLESCREQEVEPLAHWLVEATFADARTYQKLGSESALAHLLQALATVEQTDRVLTVVENLSKKKIAEHAIRWLSGDAEEQKLALDAIKVLPERQLPAMLADVCELPRGKARTRGVAALMARGERLLAVASQRMGELGGRTTVLLLSSVNHLPLDTHSLSLYRAAVAHEDPRVRARSLSWLAYYGEQYARPNLETALASDSVEDRCAALHLLRIARPEIAADVLRALARAAKFEALPASEQRLIGLSLVLVDGQFAKGTALAWLEAKKGVSDVTRTTALWILGAVGDEECVEAITKRAKGFMSSPLKNAARTILEQMKKGPGAFDPENEIVSVLRRTGLLEHVLGSAPAELVAEEIEPEPEEIEAVTPEPAMSEEETREWLMTNMFDDLSLPPLWTEPDD